MTVDEVNLINLPKILDARGNLSFVYHNFSVIKTSRLEGLIFKHIRPGSLDNNKVISCISQRLRPNLRFQGAAISWADYLPLRQPFSQWLPAFAGQSLSDRLT